MKMTRVLDLEMEAVSLRRGLAHQAGLQAGQAVAHLALDFRAGRERRHGVDHDDVHRARAHQGVADFQGLFAGVGLGHQQLVEVDPQLVGVGRVERVLGVDEARGAAGLLHLGHHVQGQGGLARAFRTVDLDDAPARQAADAQGHIEAERAGGDGFDLDDLALLAELHHRAFAKSSVDLGERRFQSALLIAVFFTHEAQHRLRHWRRPSYPILPKAPPSIAGPTPLMQPMYTVCSCSQYVLFCPSVAPAGRWRVPSVSVSWSPS